MAVALTHLQRGVYTFVNDALSPFQTVANPFTGEHVLAERSTDMVASSQWYHIDFSKGGWAYLTRPGGGTKLWLSKLSFKKVAVQYPHGGIAIQDSVTKDCVWISEHHAKVSRTVEIAHQKKLVVTIYEVERGITETMQTIPHPRLGTHFWDMRNVRHAIMGAPKSDWEANDWVSANFHHAQDKWQKQGGQFSQWHFFQSAKAWNANAQALTASPMTI